MATDELDLHDLGAFLEEPETVASPDVAEDDENLIADEVENVDEPEADEIPEQPAEEQLTESEQIKKMISEEDFAAFQSKKDLEIKALREENEKLKASSTTPSEPSTQEVRRYEELRKRYEDAYDLAINGATEEERGQGREDYGALRSQLLYAESVIMARKAGIDPDDPAYVKALQETPITSSSDIRAIAWQVRATATPLAAREAALTKREAELDKIEKSLDERIKEEVARQVAAKRQLTGVNAVPQTQPTGTTNRQQILRKYQAAKMRGDIDEVLEMKAQYPFLG